MENKPDTTPKPYQGPSPPVTASNAFFGRTLADTLGFAAVWGGAMKLFKKNSFIGSVKHTLSSPIIWGISAVFAIIEGARAFNETKQVEASHNQLLADNIGMRSQLNQTGQILRHVAAQVEKGDMPDSQLAVDNSAPPSHVAKLEAERAAAELAEKSPTIH